ALATVSPIKALGPLLTITAWENEAEAPCAMMRPVKSVLPPGSDTRMRIGFEGYAWAEARPAAKKVKQAENKDVLNESTTLSLFKNWLPFGRVLFRNKCRNTMRDSIWRVLRRSSVTHYGKRLGDQEAAGDGITFHAPDTTKL